MITVQLPLPPSVNGLYATVRGRRIKTQHARKWHRDASWSIKIEAKGRKIKGPWAVDVVLPRSMRGDCDNRLKILLDACVASGVVPDDRYVDGITVKRTGETSECLVTLRGANAES